MSEFQPHPPLYHPIDTLIRNSSINTAINLIGPTHQKTHYKPGYQQPTKSTIMSKQTNYLSIWREDMPDEGILETQLLFNTIEECKTWIHARYRNHNDYKFIHRVHDNGNPDTLMFIEVVNGVNVDGILFKIVSMTPTSTTLEPIT